MVPSKNPSIIWLSLLSGIFRADKTLPEPQMLVHPHHNARIKKERLLSARGRGAECPILGKQHRPPMPSTLSLLAQGWRGCKCFWWRDPP